MFRAIARMAVAAYQKFKSLFKGAKQTNSHSAFSNHYSHQEPRKVRRMNEHELARANGIPKCLRQYAKRYGGLDVAGILQIDRQQRSSYRV